jgi:hypothetical protein
VKEVKETDKKIEAAEKEEKPHKREGEVIKPESS